jgi:hypothetical protein
MNTLQMGHLPVDARTPFKQSAHPHLCPQGTQAQSAAATMHIAHVSETEESTATLIYFGFADSLMVCPSASFSENALT